MFRSSVSLFCTDVTSLDYLHMHPKIKPEKITRNFSNAEILPPPPELGELVDGCQGSLCITFWMKLSLSSPLLSPTPCLALASWAAPSLSFHLSQHTRPSLHQHPAHCNALLRFLLDQGCVSSMPERQMLK